MRHEEFAISLYGIAIKHDQFKGLSRSLVVTLMAAARSGHKSGHSTLKSVLYGQLGPPSARQARPGLSHWRRLQLASISPSLTDANQLPQRSFLVVRACFLIPSGHLPTSDASDIPWRPAAATTAR